MGWHYAFVLDKLQVVGELHEISMERGGMYEVALVAMELESRVRPECAHQLLQYVLADYQRRY